MAPRGSFSHFLEGRLSEVQDYAYVRRRLSFDAAGKTEFLQDDAVTPRRLKLLAADI
jgi:hypothetical protein